MDRPWPWPFYLVVRQDDRRLHRHPIIDEALEEAKRLAVKEGAVFNVMRITHRVEPERVPVVVTEVPMELDAEAKQNRAQQLEQPKKRAQQLDAA